VTRSGAQDEDVRNKILRRLVGDAEAGALGSLEHYLGEYAGFEELVRDEYRILSGQREATRSEAVSTSGPGERVARQAKGGFFDEVLQRLSGRRVTFERYTLGGEVGSGGQGTVLRVFDEDLRRHLAMKVLRQQVWEQAQEAREHVDTRSLAQFLEEAQVTAQLDHPGIVPVHELGLDAEGRVYFTMKLVKGQTLQEVFELVARGAEGWTRTRALSVLLRVCEAMAYAHAKGVIHRDLKPSNVMVGRYGEVYVMDWGLARTLERPDEKDVRVRPEAPSSIVHSERRKQATSSPDPDLVTMDGDVIGTPAYMSPEQATGRVDEMGPAADVYAVGAMLYHLLAGHKPYVEPGMRLSSHAIWYQVRKGPPEALVKRAPDAPTELVAICEKAMAREWRERYADMGEVAEDLRAFLEHRVVAAYRTGAIAELRKWVERNKALSSSAAAAVLLLIAGLTTSLVFKASSDRNAMLARENAEEAGKQASIARTNEERALASEALAREEKERAQKKTDEVLRLSAMQKLDDLVAEADRLWPALPEIVPTYEAWLRGAQELVDELPALESKLLELRSKALPWTEEVKDRDEHPRHDELARMRRQLERMRAGGPASETPAQDPNPQDVGLDFAALTTDANELNRIAWDMVDPERQNRGDEARGLLIARRALDLGANLPAPERALIRDTLAWGLLAAGRFDEALAEEETALQEAEPGRRATFEGYVEKMRRAFADEARRLEKRVADLEREVSSRPDWVFEDSQDKWWHGQVQTLVRRILEFVDPEEGLLGMGISAEHGWGMKKRLEFSTTIRDRSVSGPEVAARWTEAIQSIASVVECPLYGALSIKPQLGLVPIGRDPESGLWEFAHLQSGEPAARGTDRRLLLKEETGLVFVLLPGGTFTMGAQRNDPAGESYDPRARSAEGPPHEVRVSPFFLSKFEMTQGQWKRIRGRNPSLYGPHKYVLHWNRSGHKADLLHPVERVSWTTCAEVCGQLGLLLPSEAQWEYGARAGTTLPWWTGTEPESLAAAANLADAWARTHGASPEHPFESWDDGNCVHAPVGGYEPNPFGLFDMQGNVWEWCQERFDEHSYHSGQGQEPPADPIGSSNRVRRGGSFETSAERARSSARGDAAPESLGSGLGLRPARALEP
jgi:formylglycine-generating enzyme required for sulfatase activity/serine/threonine protein kinase